MQPNMATRPNATGQRLDAKLASDVSSSPPDFDDDEFFKFCGEIDHIIGHDPVPSSSQKQKQSIASSHSSRPDELPVLSIGGADINAALPSWHTHKPLGSSQPHQIRHQQSITENRQPSTQRFGPRERSGQGHIDSHQQDAERERAPKPHRYQTVQYPRSTAKRAVFPGDLPPAFVKKLNQKPAAGLTMPSDLMQRERVLRDRFEDTWLRNAAEKHAERMIMLEKDSKLTAPQEKCELDDDLSQENDFDISKFRAANKKTKVNTVDRLLATTYKGYNTSMARQGTLPSLHSDSTLSKGNSSVEQVTSKWGRSHPSDDSHEMKYNASEEALINIIESEFS